MRVRLTGLIIAGALVSMVSACGPSREVRPEEYNDPEFKGPQGSILGRPDDTLFNFGKGSDAKSDAGAGVLGVNAYLWRGALDTLSFMPLASADPFGGVIITDWYQPPASPGERFKATAYILGRQLRSDAVRISLFRQVQQNGQWVDAPVSPATTTEVEDKVLTRARELRAQSGS